MQPDDASFTANTRMLEQRKNSPKIHRSMVVVFIDALQCDRPALLASLRAAAVVVDVGFWLCTR